MAGRSAAARSWIMASAAGLLAAAAIGWAAYPVHGGGRGTRIALTCAVATGALSVARLALAGVRPTDVPFLASVGRHAVDWLLEAVSVIPWTEGMLIAVLALEALHPARPWHTGLLAVALLAYLFAVHLAETHAGPGALRPQLPLIAAGLGLTAIAVGAAALPGRPAGPLALLAGGGTAVAAVIVAALVLPGPRGGRR
jgi:hypothetical protein